MLAAIDSLEQQWPGLRDRLVAEGPTLRSHIHAYVDGERAGLETPVAERSRLDVIAAISGGQTPARYRAQRGRSKTTSTASCS